MRFYGFHILLVLMSTLGIITASPIQDKFPLERRFEPSPNVGKANVSPTSFFIGDSVSVVYTLPPNPPSNYPDGKLNPYFIDFYLQGQFPSQPGAVEFTPMYLLSRNVYPFQEETFDLQITVPTVPTSAVNWKLWTQIIFPGSSNGTLEAGDIPVDVEIKRK